MSELSPAWSKRAASLVNSEAYFDLPPEDALAIRDYLDAVADGQSVEETDLPEAAQTLLDKSGLLAVPAMEAIQFDPAEHPERLVLVLASMKNHERVILPNEAVVSRLHGIYQITEGATLRYAYSADRAAAVATETA